MPRPKKKVIETLVETPLETPVEVATEAPKAEVAVEESIAKKRFRVYMENYRNTKPEKYKLKEPELVKILNSL